MHLNPTSKLGYLSFQCVINRRILLHLYVECYIGDLLDIADIITWTLLCKICLDKWL